MLEFSGELKPDFHWVLIQRPESICGSACCADSVWLLLETALYSSCNIYSSSQCSGSFCPGFIKCSLSVFSWSNRIQQFIIIFNNGNASLTSLKADSFMVSLRKLPGIVSKGDRQEKTTYFWQDYSFSLASGVKFAKSNTTGNFNHRSPFFIISREKSPCVSLCSVLSLCEEPASWQQAVRSSSTM